MTRWTATFVWAAMLLVPFAFLGVASSVAHPMSHGFSNAILVLALAAVGFLVALSHALPPQLGPRRANDRRAVAFTRILVSLALGEAAAIAPLVAYMLSGDPWLLGVLALALVWLAVLHPSDRRWERLMPALPDSPGSTREVRR